MRDTPHLAAVEAIDDALVLSTMRFPGRTGPMRVTTRSRGLRSGRRNEMAGQLIEGLTGDWKPEKYTNEYRANLMKIIEAKRKNRTPKLQRQEMEVDSNVVDLMERLRASLGQAETTKRRATGGRAQTKRTAAKGRSPGRRRAA
jgi:DNA end-binding protein Ku